MDAENVDKCLQRSQDDICTAFLDHFNQERDNFFPISLVVKKHGFCMSLLRQNNNSCGGVIPVPKSKKFKPIRF